MKSLEKKQKENLGNKEDNISSGFSKKIKRGLFTMLTNQVNKRKNPERYFQDVLEKSEFKKLKILVGDSDSTITWEELAKRGVVKIENGKVEGIYWKGDLDLSSESVKIKTLWKIKIVKGDLVCWGLKSLENLGELREIGGQFLLTYTRIKTLGKLKRTGGTLSCENVGTLEDLGELEEVGGDIYLMKTSIKTLGKLRWVEGSIECRGLENLEDMGDLEKVGGISYLTGTPYKFQMNFIKKIKTNKSWRFGGNKKGIEELLEIGTIPGYLDVKNLQVDSQIKILDMLRNGQLKVTEYATFGGDRSCIEKLLEQEKVIGTLDMKDSSFSMQIEGLYRVFITKDLRVSRCSIQSIYVQTEIEKIFIKLYSGKEKRLNLDVFKEVYGEYINNIEDKKFRKLAKEMLIVEYNRKKKQLNNKIEKIKIKTDTNKTTDEEKIKLRDQIRGLIIQFEEQKEKMESFGVKLDDL